MNDREITSDPADCLAEAAQAADAAASKAGVEVRALRSIDELREADALMRAVWRTDTAPVSMQMMRAVEHAGGYVAGAYDVTASLVGVTVGFLGTDREGAGTGHGGRPHVHSHATCVDDRWQGRGLGFALKLHQRAWALGRGIDTVTWTYDPLVRRNAVFNLVKLGAVVDDYLPNFYGDMHDGLNSGDETDRLYVRWPLATRSVADAAAGVPVTVPAASEPTTVLTADERGRPRRTGSRPSADADLAVAVPTDIESLRATSPAVAQQWRRAVREAMTDAVAGGYGVAGITRDGCYVMRKAPQ